MLWNVIGNPPPIWRPPWSCRRPQLNRSSVHSFMPFMHEHPDGFLFLCLRSPATGRTDTWRHYVAGGCKPCCARAPGRHIATASGQDLSRSLPMLRSSAYDLVQQFLHQHGDCFGLTAHSRPGLPACWPEHPKAVVELVGIATAWTSLFDAVAADGESSSSSTATHRVSATDWLHLSNATAPALTRVHDALRLCHQSNEHISDQGDQPYQIDPGPR